LLEKNPPQILVDAHGVGYEIEVPMSTFYNLPVSGQQVSLFTHLVVREDAHLLFGFGTETERRAFRQLVKIPAWAHAPPWPCSRPVRGRTGRRSGRAGSGPPGENSRHRQEDGRALLLELKDKLLGEPGGAPGTAAHRRRRRPVTS